MPKYKLKKNQNIGALSAESDSMLEKVFVDTGYLSKLLDTEDPTFLVLGRTGSGKTAIINQIISQASFKEVLDPDELSMQYLHSNAIVKMISEWGVHLDIFFKYLWRHICILELIKLRYSKSKEGKFSILNLFNPDEHKTAKMALAYLEKHGAEYWITADTHIKNFTTELVTKLSADSKIGFKLGFNHSKIESAVGMAKEELIKQGVDAKIIERTQSIVNDYQMTALNELLKRLSSNSFNDPKKKFYLVIDDLDKNWMPNDIFYITLIKSLLHTVKEINSKLKGVKIIVALRTNIFYRVFKKSSVTEPQREKWNDVLVDLKWNKPELIELINKRLVELFREQYTTDSPTLENILPSKSKKEQIDPIDYLLNRTLFRPRDVIDFFNTIILRQSGDLSLTWSKIYDAEGEYSKRRLDSILDEWKDSYFGLPATFNLLKKLGKYFKVDNITKEDTEDLLTYKDCEKCKWLKMLQTNYLENRMLIDDIIQEIINALYITGIIGIKKTSNDNIIFSYERPINTLELNQDEINNYTFFVHQMFWQALGINRK
jgi:Cdc6-like AAA superfamily ATPase